MIEIEKPQIECIENPADETYGKYVVEPLERGYGTTLGNALRRIMLSSLPGTAPTTIKIDGVQEERELVVEYGKKMSAARLSTGTSGNISIYNAEKGLVALSPSGMDYFSTTPEDVVILDLDAKVVDGKRKPSSEWALHTTFYKHKPHARAVVHTHSVYCTTLAKSVPIEGFGEGR